MNLSQMMIAMAEAGCSPEQMAHVAANLQGQRSSNAERQARYRARKAEAETVTRNVTSVTSVTRNAKVPPSLPPLKEKSPPITPSKENNPPISPPSKTPQAAVIEILTECLSLETANDLVSHRRAKKSPLTAGSAKGLVKQFREYGDPEAAAMAMMANGWTGFKSDWMQSQARAGPSKPEKMSAITRALLNLEAGNGNQTQASSNPKIVYEVPRLVGVG